MVMLLHVKLAEFTPVGGSGATYVDMRSHYMFLVVNTAHS